MAVASGGALIGSTVIVTVSLSDLPWSSYILSSNVNTLISLFATVGLVNDGVGLDVDDSLTFSPETCFHSK